MSFLSQHAKQNRTLPAQLAFTVLAFVLTDLLSSVFMSEIVRNGLVLRANSVLDLTEDRIAANLTRFESTLNGFASETRAIILRGDSKEMLEGYIDDVSRLILLDSDKTHGLEDFFVYLEAGDGRPALLHSSYWDVPGDYKPEDQSWYKLALEAKGGVVETPPYISDNDETLYTYAKCIFDDTGERLGVVCQNVRIDFLGKSIVDTSLNQGGYGILINQEGWVLFHPNVPFRGIDMRNPDIPLSAIAGEISKGEISEKKIITYKNENGVAFFHTLDNGWRLGLVTPREQYYRSLSSMRLILSLLSAMCAVVLIVILIRLDAAREKSDEESRQKSAFLANMSHEIRTPINAIVGMTSIGRTAVAPERKDYCFAKIDDASRHLLGVINDILDLSKIEANKIELSPHDFNFEKMLQQVVNVVNFRIDGKSQKLTVYIDKDIPKILYADDQRLAQIITNLLNNAIKFTPENGAIDLRAFLLNDDSGVCTIQIEVADNGVGITAEQQENLFIAFEQAESSTTRKYGGTGLGLSISKSLTEMMDGSIWVESEYGKGSMFAFTVKANRGDDTKYGLADYGMNWGNIRILTVDDDHDILEYFQEIVTGFGASCEVAGGGAEALRYIEKNKSYNIYFVDLKMPDIDGIALTKEIRAREQDSAHSIVIMISSADLSAVENEAKEAGVDMFLLKPIFPSAIADVISECIGIIREKTNDDAKDIDGIFAGRHILFAEDIEINREIVITILEPTLLEIDCAGNGAEALEMFAKNSDKYDMIFMDVQMPEMDGYEATRRIRGIGTQKAKGIPIVAMTANVFKEDVDKCLAAGMSGHVGKPIDMENLLNVMKKYLC